MALKTPAAQALTDQAAFYSTDLPWVDDITYEGQPIAAEFEYGEDLDDQTGLAVAVLMIVVKKADVAKPAYRDSVVVNSVTWKVRRIGEGDGLAWKLTCYSDERPNV